MADVVLEDVHKRFGDRTVVRGIDLRIRSGEFFTLLGPSGCGKTTTLRIVAGFERPDRGRVRIGDADVTDVPPNRRHVGMVFQSYALFPNMSAWDNVAFGLRIRRVPAPEVDRRVREMLEAVGLLEHAHKYPHQLSGGQQQRVALARALITEPRVLLLDEPLSALDAKIRVQLRELVKQLQRRSGTTAIYVTHDQEEALALSDRVAVMNQGRIVQVGTSYEIYARPATRFVAEFVGNVNLLPARVVDAGRGEVELLGCRVPLAAAAGRHGRVTVAFRPEEAGLGADGAAGPALRWRGRVESLTMLGNVVRLRVRVGDALLLVDRLNTLAARDLAVGADVEVSVPAGALFLVDDGQEGAS